MKLLQTIDLSKIDKTRIVPRTYTDKEGKEITSKDYKIEAIELKEAKIIKEGDTWQLVKTHFIVEAQTKEEREAKKETVFLGDGLQFKDKSQDGVDTLPDDSEIPF